VVAKENDKWTKRYREYVMGSFYLSLVPGILETRNGLVGSYCSLK